MLSFRTPSGGAFDGVALDVESTKLRNVALRSRRAVALARQLREAAGDTPLAIVPFNPRGLERRPTAWPKFPWAELAESADAFAPMIYTGGALEGIRRDLRLRDARAAPAPREHREIRTSRSTWPAESPTASGPDELAGFVAAVEDDGGTIGVSLYDWMTTPPRAWKALAPLTG